MEQYQGREDLPEILRHPNGEHLTNDVLWEYCIAEIIPLEVAWQLVGLKDRLLGKKTKIHQEEEDDETVTEPPKSNEKRVPSGLTTDDYKLVSYDIPHLRVLDLDQDDYYIVRVNFLTVQGLYVRYIDYYNVDTDQTLAFVLSHLALAQWEVMEAKDVHREERDNEGFDVNWLSHVWYLRRLVSR